ncbi:MAG: hypothetical protein KC442_02145 [Thermomicrobiales bacterium]|nr:hypothetical protein [Thermomicrobiales bacterium]
MDDYAIDLESNPECARRIAIILGLFVQVEHGLVPILSWVADMSLDQARVSLELQKQNARKVTFLQGVCDGISPEWPRDVEAGKIFAAAAHTANRIRNKYAHATYSVTGHAGSEQLSVAVFADSLRNATRIEVATIESLDTEIHFLKIPDRRHAQLRRGPSSKYPSQPAGDPGPHRPRAPATPAQSLAGIRRPDCSA